MLKVFYCLQIDEGIGSIRGSSLEEDHGMAVESNPPIPFE